MPNRFYFYYASAFHIGVSTSQVLFPYKIMKNHVQNEPDQSDYDTFVGFLLKHTTSNRVLADILVVMWLVITLFLTVIASAVDLSVDGSERPYLTTCLHYSLAALLQQSQRHIMIVLCLSKCVVFSRVFKWSFFIALGKNL